MQRRIKELAAARRKAEEAARLKGDFLANTSHEIRNLLNGVLGMTGLVLDSELTEDQRECLQAAKNSADSLLAVINDILDFSRIEAGKLTINPIETDISEVVDEVMKSMAVSAHQKNLELLCHFHAGTTGRLIVDPGRIRQVLVNLLSNAIKFTERGEVELSVSAELCSHQKVELHWTVRDTGIGIEPDRQAAIFAPFVQADRNTARRFGGTGLGLAICSQLVRLMDGRIWIDSTAGEGSTFHCESDKIRNMPALPF